ncbi:MAG: hypothetical protein A2Y41_00650 [Spirochaetes bacterium GWB1_36_13]|nr:MAG: hypothetical protein A2Y41_00650 [Spirochaetes bacterium GWB1_36_13]
MYKGSLRRIEILSKLFLILITLFLSIFLINLGEKILSDIANWSIPPKTEDFKNHEALKEQALKEKEVQKKINLLENQISGYDKLAELTRRKYLNEKKSFDNWIETRKTIGSPNQDQEVLERAKKLDSFNKIAQDWEDKIEALAPQRKALNQEMNEIRLKQEEIENKGDELYNAAYKKFMIKVFFIRLGLVLPLLALGVFLFIRLKKSRYRFMLISYFLFSLYLFFVGLAPYLPDFGGYIKYIVGIILTVFGGYYSIRQLIRYTEKKKKELEESKEERSKKIEHEAALKSYKAHCCPSCEKDFLSNQWSLQKKLSLNRVPEEEAPNFCRFCGLELFGKCPSCGSRNFVHFPYCNTCGSPIQKNRNA